MNINIFFVCRQNVIGSIDGHNVFLLIKKGNTGWAFRSSQCCLGVPLPKGRGGFLKLLVKAIGANGYVLSQATESCKGKIMFV
ncbi:MAG: hypothetical protein FJ264_15580 [Planctomycetes bacterium]|nr:hypothetical protein [Planctomycetota bacterium]